MKAALPLHAAVLALLFLSACSSGGFSAVELLAAEDDEPQHPPWFARADLSAEVEACDDPEEIEADPETLPDMLDSLPDCSVVTLLPGNYPAMMPYELDGLTLRCSEPALLDDDEPNPDGCYVQSIIPVRIGALIVEDLIFNGVATNFGGEDDYGLEIHILEQIRIVNNVFDGEYNHDISTKENVGLTEVVDNLFITCARHCVEVGQNGNVASRPQQSGTMIIRDNRFLRPALHAVTQRSNSLMLVEDNSFIEVGGESIQNWPYWEPYDYGQPDGPEKLLLPEGPLRTIVRGNRFEGSNGLRFEGRGIADDSVLIQDNSGSFACIRVPMPERTAEAHERVETRDPPRLEADSDVDCPVEEPEVVS